MNKEEIKEYLKRVDELEFKLVDEDKDALQWLIFGYNECARLLNEKEKENQGLKELEKEHQRINGCLHLEIKELKEEKQEWINLLGMFKNQQKQFIEYLDNESNEVIRDNGYHKRICLEILSKYKEIIGGKDE